MARLASANTTPTCIEKRLKGITLIECLITLSLMLILTTMSVASYRYLISRNKTSTYLNELISTINYARSEALTRRLPVSICNSQDGQICNGRWRDGWIVFLNPTHAAQPTEGAHILRMHPALPAGDQLYWRAALAKNDSLSFNGLGHVQQDGRFIVCPVNHPEYAAALVLSLTGRVRVERQGTEQNICLPSR